MPACPSCRAEVEGRFRPGVEDDPAKALRVSRYLGDDDESRHVRFSVWGGGEAPRAEAAVSLSDEEAERLARFLEDTARVPGQPAAG